MSFLRYPKYKVSGVEWLGEVPAHWEVVKVRWLCEIKKRIVGELGFDVLSITQKGIRVKDTESNDGQLLWCLKSKHQIMVLAARATDAKMVSALLCHTNGLGSSL